MPFVHKDRTALDLLTDVLSGRTGRLYKGLVLGRQVANEVAASVDLKKYDGVVQIEAVVKDGKDPAAVEAAIYEEIERLQKEPVPAEELQKVKNQAKANAYRRLSSPSFIMFQLLIYDGPGRLAVHQHLRGRGGRGHRGGPPARGRAALRRRRTARSAIFLRKEGAAPDDPELAALPAQAQAMARQGLQQIEAETDAAKLREGIAQMRAGHGQAPAGDEAGAGAIAETRPGAPGRPGERRRSERHEDAVVPRRIAARAPGVRASRRPSRRTRTSSCSSRSRTTPPRPADHRVVLKNGMVVFIAEDPTLPLVNIALTVRTGSYLEPAGKEGLAALHRLADPPRGHEVPHRRAARRAARLPGRPGRHRHRRHRGHAPASTACPTTWTSR